MQKLSNRLHQIAMLVPKNSRIADIGTDHGYLPVYLAENKFAEYIIACDLREKPLAAASKNISVSNTENIDLRISDGFENISPDEIDTAVIAGMGGEVISGIIQRCYWLKNGKYTLILQPTTSPEKLREFLSLSGYSVNCEKAVSENGKLYSIMLVKYSNKTDALPPYKLYIGNLTPTDADSTAYIKKQLNRISKLANDLRYIENKHNDFIYYSQIANKLKSVLGGHYGT